MDVTNLSPAPWEADKDFQLWSEVTEAVVWDQDAADFTALARNAFDVMIRRGWSAHRLDDSRWAVMPYDFVRLGLAHVVANDPYTALVEADKWYIANIEAKQEVSR
jgi:hypothetical protein